MWKRLHMTFEHDTEDFVEKDKDLRRHGSLSSWSWGNQNWFPKDAFGRNSSIWRSIRIEWCLKTSYCLIINYWWISS